MAVTSVRRRLAGADGAAALEFALIVPILIMLVFGIIGFGRALNVQVSLTGAAREGARVMAIQNDEAAARDATRNAAPSLNPLLTDAEIAVSGCVGSPASYTVTATRPVTYEVPLYGQLNLSLQGQGVMRCGG